MEENTLYLPICSFDPELVAEVRLSWWRVTTNPSTSRDSMLLSKWSKVYRQTVSTSIARALYDTAAIKNSARDPSPTFIRLKIKNVCVCIKSAHCVALRSVFKNNWYANEASGNVQIKQKAMHMMMNLISCHWSTWLTYIQTGLGAEIEPVDECVFDTLCLCVHWPWSVCVRFDNCVCDCWSSFMHVYYHNVINKGLSQQLNSLHSVFTMHIVSKQKQKILFLYIRQNQVVFYKRWHLKVHLKEIIVFTFIKISLLCVLKQQ